MEGAPSRRTAAVLLPDGSRAEVSYALVRRARRTIGLRIDAGELTVIAHPRIPLYEIEKAIAEKSRWILKKFREYAEWREKAGTAEARFCDGGTLPFRGRTLRISLCETEASPRLRPGGAGSFVLSLPLPKEAAASEIRDMTARWLAAEAARVLEERLRQMEKFSPRKASGFRLTSATTFWGKCHSTGLIRLNWRLIFFENDVIDYVAAHELAHLSEMNHSPAFWAVVRSIKPNYEKAKKLLRGVPLKQLPL